MGFAGLWLPRTQYREGNRGEWGMRIELPVGTGNQRENFLGKTLK